MITTTTRNATLEDLVTILRDQHARKLDVVAPATSIRARGGLITVKGSEAIITDDGVTSADGTYRPTAVFDEGAADKLGIPISYLRKLRETRPDLYDANVNGWLHGRTRVTAEGPTVVAQPDARSFLVRALRGDEGETGVVRAMLSNGFNPGMDNLDALVGVLDGINAAGVQATVERADLTERRMYVRIAAPEISALAPGLLKGYRSPFSGEDGEANPVVFAGLALRNSEVGNGAWQLSPMVVIQVCSNGMTITRDAMRAVHVGQRLDDGVINWSAETQTKNVELLVARTRDAVAAFLSTDWLNSTVERLEEAAGVPITKTAETVTAVIKGLGFPKEHVDGVLDHFIRGGQMTAGGIAQALTSYSQTLDDADLADEFDGKVEEAMALARR